MLFSVNSFAADKKYEALEASHLPDSLTHGLKGLRVTFQSGHSRKVNMINRRLIEVT